MRHKGSMALKGSPPESPLFPLKFSAPRRRAPRSFTSWASESFLAGDTHTEPDRRPPPPHPHAPIPFSPPNSPLNLHSLSGVGSAIQWKKDFSHNGFELLSFFLLPFFFARVNLFVFFLCPLALSCNSRGRCLSRPLFVLEGMFFEFPVLGRSSALIFASAHGLVFSFAVSFPPSRFNPILRLE